MREGKKRMRLVFAGPFQQANCLTRSLDELLQPNAHNQPLVSLTIPILQGRKQPQRVWSPCLRSHSWWDQAPSWSGRGSVETFLCLTKDEAGLWMDLCVHILFPMKCLFTVIGYLKVDFNERNDVLIFYIEIHMNFHILKICNRKQLLFQKSKKKYL